MEWADLAKFVMSYLQFAMKNETANSEHSVQTVSADELLPHYDFIVVGAGSAGSVVASRLSEYPDWKILLLEAGGQENIFSKTPAVWSGLLGSTYDWNYTTFKQERTCLAEDGFCKYPRGKVLGGSSSINGMVHTRGYKSDYDRWGKDNPGWHFHDLVSFFRRSEGSRVNDLDGIGKEGPLTIDYPSYKTMIRYSILQAGFEMGWKNDICQDYEYDCIEFALTNIQNGTRCSTSTAYLEPISTRPNLHIITNALVNRIVINGTEAEGVQITWGGKEYVARTKKEIILSAGAIESPKLLMLSGIGPSEHLKSVGMEVISDLPVGNNLQDHFIVNMAFDVINETTTVHDLEKSIDQYVDGKTGPLGTNGLEFMVYSSLGYGGPPTIQHYISTTSDSCCKHRVHWRTTVMRPKTTGMVRLNASDPTGPPLIDMNSYSAGEDAARTMAALVEAYRFFERPAMLPYHATLVPAPPCSNTTDTLYYFSCLIQHFTDHRNIVGTVKMSPKYKEGVVSNELKVYGVQHLRVIDASIAPKIISTATNAMAVMIGEKGASIIETEYKTNQAI